LFHPRVLTATPGPQNCKSEATAVNNSILAYNSRNAGNEESAKNPTGQNLEPSVPTEQPRERNPDRKVPQRNVANKILRTWVSPPLINLTELYKWQTVLDRVDERMEPLILVRDLTVLFE